MDLGLAGKRAAVMAASDGLGKAAALSLAREGAGVAICARAGDRLGAAAKEIRGASGSPVVPIAADVTVAADVERFVSEAAAGLGGLDALVLNCGGPPPGRAEAFTDADWLAAFDSILLSIVRGVRAALPRLREAGGGSVVLIASSSVKQPLPNLALSNALRPAAVALMKTLSLEHAHEGIRFNVVLPGAFRTSRIERLTLHRAQAKGVSFEDALAEREREAPLGRLGDPAEIGDVVAFLASPRAAYVTGAVVQVDGGVVRFPF